MGSHFKMFVQKIRFYYIIYNSQFSILTFVRNPTYSSICFFLKYYVAYSLFVYRYDHVTYVCSMQKFFNQNK